MAIAATPAAAQATTQPEAEPPARRTSPRTAASHGSSPTTTRAIHDSSRRFTVPNVPKKMRVQPWTVALSDEYMRTRYRPVLRTTRSRRPACLTFAAMFMSSLTRSLMASCVPMVS